MDLLRQILLRLPAPKVAEIAPALLPEVVKYLNRGRMSSETVEHYIEAFRKHSPDHPGLVMLYCQGLIAPYATGVIPIRILMERAAFLQDERAYLDFAEQSESTGSYVIPDISLISGVPEIQAAIFATGDPTNMRIGDPEIINWTRGLVRYCSDNPPRFSDPIIDWTRGYIHAPATRTDRTLREYLTGYLTREMQNYPDPFVDSPILNETIQKAISYGEINSNAALNIYMESGYFPPALFKERLTVLVETALAYIRPKFIRRYLSEARAILASTDVYLKFGNHIKHGLIRRAEEMLILLGQIDSEYITSLRILTGRRIDPDLLPRLVERWSTIPDFYRAVHTPALRLMIAVAHPQIPKSATKLTELFRSSAYGRHSSIFYDLAHYLSCYSETAEYSILNSYVIERFVRLHTVGRLLEAFPPEEIDLLIGWFDRINGRPQSKLREGFAERYRQILRILRS